MCLTRIDPEYQKDEGMPFVDLCSDGQIQYEELLQALGSQKANNEDGNEGESNIHSEVEVEEEKEMNIQSHDEIATPIYIGRYRQSPSQLSDSRDEDESENERSRSDIIYKEYMSVLPGINLQINNEIAILSFDISRIIDGENEDFLPGFVKEFNTFLNDNNKLEIVYVQNVQLNSELGSSIFLKTIK